MQSAAGAGSSGALFIDSFQFWIIAIAAIFALRCTVESKGRQRLWAAFNGLFITSVLGWTALWLFGVLAAVFTLLQTFERLKHPFALGASILVGASALFLAYKANLFLLPGVSSVQQILVAVGFSFVFLRLFDVVRALQDGGHKAPGVAELINYLLPFHMLAAGPIQSYDEFTRQPGVPEPLTVREALYATQRIASGLFKKFVLAYALQKTFLTDLEADGLWFFVEIQVLLIWLYLDFSAYSDVAVGIGRLMGVATPENFDRPWLARNLIDFWDRWHISLSQWIRRNLFIPIQLKLMRRFPTSDPIWIASVAIAVSFFMAGVWHGLTAGWLLWGGMHALGLLVVRLQMGRMQKRRSPQQLAEYRGNNLILVAARLATIEYAAAAFAVVFLVK